MVEKLVLPFSRLAGVEGEVTRRYGIWDEKGEISRPAIFVIDRAATVRYAYVGEGLSYPKSILLTQKLWNPLVAGPTGRTRPPPMG
jgi:peroxiredoxin